MEYYNELPDGPLGIIRSKTSRVWHTDKKTAVSSSSQRDSGLTAVFFVCRMFLFFFRKGDVRCCFSGKSLAYNTRTDSTPSCQGRSKSRYRNQPQKSQLLATHAMMMIAARIESVTKRTREIILRLFLTLKDCCLKDSTSSL